MNAHTRTPQCSRILALSGILCLLSLTVRGASSTINLISRRDPNLAAPTAGNGNSFLPMYSPDGKHLIFASGADNLTAAPQSSLRVNLYDYTGPGTLPTLLTPPMGGGPGAASQSIPVGVSGDTVIFLSTAPDLVPSVTNHVQQLYAQSLANGTRRLLSRNMATGAQALRDITYAVTTGSGRYVFFETTSGELAGNPTNTLNQIYRLDLQDSDRIELVSHISGGASPEIGPISDTTPNDDGTVAAYISAVSTGSQVVVNDIGSGSITPIAAGGPPSSGDFYNTEISADGRYLAVRRTGRTASPALGVYWIDLMSQQISTCSAGLHGSFVGDDTTFAPLVLFPDGKTVAFEVANTNLQATQIVFWNSDKGLFGMDGFLPFVPFVSMEPGNSSQPALSPDGTSIAFLSTATNVVSGVDDGLPHLYIRVLETGHTTLISHDPLQNPIPECPDLQIAFRPDSTQLAFTSLNDGYLPDDNNREADIYTFDLATAHIGLVSAADPSLQLVGASYTDTFLPGCVSRDGRYIVFSSIAPDLVVGDTNNVWDVFLADRQLGTIQRVSAPKDGSAQVNQPSVDAQISPDGRFVLFQSWATNLVDGQVPVRNNVYLYDTSSRTALLASPSSSVDNGSTSPSHPSMSADGRYVLYELGSGAVVRDTVAGTSLRIGTPINSTVMANTALISSTGALVVYSDVAKHLYAQNLATSNSTAFSTLPLISASPAIIPSANGSMAGIAGKSVASAPHPIFLLADTRSGATVQYFLTNLFNVSAWAMTPDASQVVFEGTASATNTSVLQVVFLNTATRQQTLISTNLAGALGNGSSRNASISDDGRFITFKSLASDLVASDSNGKQDIFIHDGLTGTIDLVSHTPAGAAPSDSSFRAAISGDGSTVAFLSSAEDLVSGSFDGIPQLFAASISAPSADTDGDGLPDAWEQHYFGNLNQGANDDPDHDGATNLQEFIAHTDPTDPQSVLKLSVSRQGGAALNLVWPTVSGVKYQIQSRSSLSSADWQNSGPIESGTGSILSQPLNPSAAGSQFFRLVIVE